MKPKNVKKIAAALTASVFCLTACSPVESKSDPVDSDKPEPVIHTITRAGSQDGNIYFVDESNKTLFNGAKFYNAHEFKRGYCIVSKLVDGKELRGVIDSTGKEVVACTNPGYFDDVDEGMLQYSEGGHYGYMDLTGKLVIPCEYSATKGFRNGMVKMEKDYKRWGILDKTGKIIVSFEYEKMGPWGDELTGVKKKGKWGFINKTGELAIAAEYDFAWSFSQGVTLVGKNKKYALINTKNEKLTDFIFDNYEKIVDVSKNEYSSTGYSESNERLVMEEGLLIVSKDKRWGLMNVKGEAVLPYEYDRIFVPDRNGKATIEKDGKRGEFDIKTKAIVWYKD